LKKPIKERKRGRREIKEGGKTIWMKVNEKKIKRREGWPG